MLMSNSAQKRVKLWFFLHIPGKKWRRDNLPLREYFIILGVVCAYQGAVCPLSGAELDSLLSCIKDLLPDLGDGFLLACLQEYDYNSELVINNILEDRLAPNLDKLDRAMPR